MSEEKDKWLPLSARGSKKGRLIWEYKGIKEKLALRLAPWLQSGSRENYIKGYTEALEDLDKLEEAAE